MKCYYDAQDQRLTVEILHAADIIALDANGKTMVLTNVFKHKKRNDLMFSGLL